MFGTGGSLREGRLRLRLSFHFFSLLCYLVVVATVLLLKSREAHSLLFSISNFTQHSAEFTAARSLGSYTPTVDPSSFVRMTNGADPLQYTSYTYTAEAFQGGDTAFRFQSSFVYGGSVGGSVAVAVFGNWMQVEFYSYTFDPLLCITENNRRYECFNTFNELNTPTVHDYIIEFHNATRQLFVLVDGAVRAQMNNIATLPPVFNVAFLAQCEAAVVQDLYFLSFNSITFQPIPRSNIQAFIRPVMSPITTYSTTNFTIPGEWNHNPGVDQDYALGKMTHRLFGTGMSWLNNRVWVSSNFFVKFTCTFQLVALKTPGFGFMLVLQNQGVNIVGGNYYMWGFASWPGFGIMFSPDPVSGGTIQLYDGSIIIAGEDAQTPQAYPSQNCSAISIGALLSITALINLYDGLVSVNVTNTAIPTTCSVSFSFDPCVAQQAVDLQGGGRSAWVGFTSTAGGSVAINTVFSSFEIFSSVEFRLLCGQISSPTLTNSASISVSASRSASSTSIHTQTSATRTRTPTPTPTPSSTVVINNVCSSASQSFRCVSGDCVEDPSSCEGELDPIETKITPSKQTISEKSRDKEIVVNVLGRSSNHAEEVVVASLKFPPNVLKPGWQVVISRPKGDYDDKALESTDDCGEKHKVDKIVSPAFQIDVYDERGHSVEKFSKPFLISTLASFDSSAKRNSLCYGYLGRSKDDRWQCSGDDQLETKETRTKNTFYVQNSIDHFTTFAVLLSGAGFGSPNCWDWIPITSLALVGVAIVLIGLCAILFCWNASFRAFVGGYDEKLKLSKVVQRLN